jgi:hypothetical protein
MHTSIVAANKKNNHRGEEKRRGENTEREREQRDGTKGQVMKRISKVERRGFKKKERELD